VPHFQLGNDKNMNQRYNIIYYIYYAQERSVTINLLTTISKYNYYRMAYTKNGKMVLFFNC